jgi:hypothetical protein
MYCRPVVRQNLPPPPPLHTAHPINFHLMNRPSKKKIPPESRWRRRPSSARCPTLCWRASMLCPATCDEPMYQAQTSTRPAANAPAVNADACSGRDPTLLRTPKAQPQPPLVHQTLRSSILLAGDAKSTAAVTLTVAATIALWCANRVSN